MKSQSKLSNVLTPKNWNTVAIAILMLSMTACSPVKFSTSGSSVASAASPAQTGTASGEPDGSPVTDPGATQPGSTPQSDPANNPVPVATTDPGSNPPPSGPGSEVGTDPGAQPDPGTNPNPVDSPTPIVDNPAPTTSSSICDFTSAIPATFAHDTVMVNHVSGDQNLSARVIAQLSNVRGDVTVVAQKIDAGILQVNGSLKALAGEVGIITGITENVCVQTAAFNGVVQNNPGMVELHGMYGPAQLTPLAQINNVGSARLVNIEVGNVHDIQGNMVIENGGTVTEIANVGGNLTLINTRVRYLHGVPNGVVTLINSQIDQYESNTVREIKIQN